MMGREAREQHITQGVIGLGILAYAFSGEGRTIAKVIGGAVVARSAWCVYRYEKARHAALQAAAQQPALPAQPPVDPSQAPADDYSSSGLRLVD